MGEINLQLPFLFPQNPDIAIGFPLLNQIPQQQQQQLTPTYLENTLAPLFPATIPATIPNVPMPFPLAEGYLPMMQQRGVARGPRLPRPSPLGDDRCKIFVGGLSWKTDENKLRDYFSKLGPIADCAVMRDRVTSARVHMSHCFILFVWRQKRTTRLWLRHVCLSRARQRGRSAVPHPGGGWVPTMESFWFMCLLDVFPAYFDILSRDRLICDTCSQKAPRHRWPHGLRVGQPLSLMTACCCPDICGSYRWRPSEPYP